MARFCLLGLILFILSSCLNDPDCVVTATLNVSIHFERITSDTGRFVLFDSVKVSGTNVLYYENQEDSVSAVALPVNPSEFMTTFRFYYASTMDSIRLSYTRKAQVISPACGAFAHYQDLAVLSTSFSSVTVVNPQLSTSAGTNLIVKL